MMNKLTIIFAVNKSYTEKLLVELLVLFLILFGTSFVLTWAGSRFRQRTINLKLITHSAFLWTMSLSLVISLGKVIYQQNIWSVQSKILQPIQTYNRKKSDYKANLDNYSRADIANMVMRQAVTGLDKQGFIAIPNCNILLPIYNDAYSEKGLNAGANYANKSAVDPRGLRKPIMGQGNYGLAAHNFNDGLTGFSSLQKETNHNRPYLQEKQLQGSDWLNGKNILLADAQGIYNYKITGQTVVSPETVSVLDPTKTAEVTIISCLFPSTNYRIITHGKLSKAYTWKNAPRKFVNEFNLKVKNTNAHVSWWNPGIEEGANGDKGGTKAN
ncbi:class A sortase [Leuconostoc citreum]